VEKQDLPFLSTAELSELIRQKEVSPVEVTETYLERIDDLNLTFEHFPSEHGTRMILYGDIQKSNGSVQGNLKEVLSIRSS